MPAPTWSHRARVAVTALAVAALVATGAGPAGAGPDWSQVSFRRIAGGCGAGDLYINPTGSVRLWEHGKSGVIRFEVKYRLYRDETTFGWQWPRLERTYRSAYFPNDHRNFATRLPTSGVHQWTQVFRTSPYRLDARAKWDRGWRRDWIHQRTILRCV